MQVVATLSATLNDGNQLRVDHSEGIRYALFYYCRARRGIAISFAKQPSFENRLAAERDIETVDDHSKAGTQAKDC